MLNEKLLLEEAKTLLDEMSRIRRDIHMHPELGGKEVRTSQLVTKFLNDLGIESYCPCDTAVVGTIHGKLPGKVVALRADMDALPMQDSKEGCEYRSQVDGVMHACGHDVHTTALMFAAKLLKAHEDELPGTVKLFFEPGEERGGFAKRMIAAGVMENPKVDAVFASHQWSGEEAGNVICHAGQVSSASGRFAVTVNGRASHGAEPQNGVDAIAIACQIVTALQQCVSRMSAPETPVVLTIGTFNGGEVRNSVAPKAAFSGIHRTPTLEQRALINNAIVNISKGIGEAFGAVVDVEIDDGAAPTINDEAMTALVSRTAATMLGQEHVGLTGGLAATGAEDCGEFMSLSKGCYYNFGAGSQSKGITALPHTNGFDVDEDCLPVAAAMHAAVALNFLRSSEG